jgi:hypothetical protein
MRGPAVEEMLVKLDHHKSRLVEDILLVNVDGKEHRLSMEYEIGGETTNSINGAAARSRVRWEGAELILETWLKTGDRETDFRDHWSLSDDGQSLTMEHRDDALAGQIAVLERAQAEAGRF